MSETSDFAEELNARRKGFVLGLGLRFTRATRDEVTAEIPVGPHLLQPYGLVHGGVYSSIAETLCSVGAALWARPRGETTVGLENTTSFLRAARDGTLRGRALPVHRGRRTQLWEVHIHDDADETVATGRVRMMVLEPGATLAGRTVKVESGEPPLPTK